MLAALCGLIVLSGCAPQPAAEEPADYVFTSGNVYTVDEAHPSAEAVAVRGNEIVYIGSSAGAAAFVGEGTEEVDLAGRTMMPGFVDAHNHALAGGLIARGMSLETDDMDELMDRIRTAVAETPAGEPVTAYGWRVHLFPDTGPRKEALDEIDSERPIYLWAVDGHSAWVNSRALEVAGVDADYPDTQPPFSFYQRDSDGTPTGWVVEIPAQLEVLGALFDVDADYVAAGTLAWMPRFSAAGITALFDAGIQGMDFDTGMGLYQQWEEDGTLPFRVWTSFYWNDPSVDPMPAVRQMRERYNTDLVKGWKLKVNLDGGDDKHNAVYVEPYSDRDDGWTGEPIIPQDVLNRAMLQADAEGIHLFCHCFGDGATRMFLDAVELAVAENPAWDRRHSTSHTNLIHPDDVSRFAELGVIADFQMAWGALDPLLSTMTLKRVGQERRDRMMGAQEVIDAGGRVSFSSDFAVAGYTAVYKPFEWIQVAVTRELVEPDGSPPLGGEGARVSLADAIAASTLGGAYNIGVEDQIGSIEVGKKADLLILGANPFEVDVYDIGDVEVEMTMMNGRIVHGGI